MNRLIVVTTLFAVSLASAQNPQENTSQSALDAMSSSTPNYHASCVEFAKRIPFERQAVPRSLKGLVPKGARTRLVQPLSDSDTLIVYEQAHPEADNLEPDEPDTNLSIVRGKQIAYHLAMKNVRMPSGSVRDWGKNAVAMDAAQLCSPDAPLTFIVTQAGNHGGFYFALQRTGTGYRFIQVSTADQGRLVLFPETPNLVEVWDSAGPNECTGCPKPFFVKTFDLDGQLFRLSSVRKTKRQYSGFQGRELLLHR